jgi:hypothetical protein
MLPHSPTESAFSAQFFLIQRDNIEMLAMVFGPTETLLVSSYATTQRTRREWTRSIEIQVGGEAWSRGSRSGPQLAV